MNPEEFVNYLGADVICNEREIALHLQRHAVRQENRYLFGGFNTKNLYYHYKSTGSWYIVNRNIHIDVGQDFYLATDDMGFILDDGLSLVRFAGMPTL